MTGTPYLERLGSQLMQCMFPQSNNQGRSAFFFNQRNIVTRLLHFWKLKNCEVAELTETVKQLLISPANTLKEFLG